MDDLYVNLLSAILGAFASGLFGIISEKSRHRQEVLSIANAFYGEVKAILEKVERRGYIQILRQAEKDKKFIHIDAKQNYFEVFANNCERIGLVPADLTFEITKFYIFAKAFVEDTDSYCSLSAQNINNSANYTEMADILEEIRSTGNKIIEKVETMNGTEKRRSKLFSFS